MAAIAVALVTLFIAYREGSSGGDYSLAPLIGCVVFLVGMVVILLIFLVRAWGWI